ncbi:MAG: hypothetical protein HXS44_09525 [Theionarchaea archaeon]|nr:hypothetical protein [Theionarchaea archaeon]
MTLRENGNEKENKNRNKNENKKNRLHIFPRKLTAKEIALGGVMAAVMAVAAFIPVTVVAGVGKVISAAVMLEPLIGVILGPVLGMYAAAAGAFAGQILAPQGAIFGLLTFIPPTVGATAAGMVAHKRWKAGSLVMGAVILLWYSTSIGRQLYYYPYMPLLFLGLVLLFRNNLGEWIHVKYNEVLGFKGKGIGILIAGLSVFIIAYSGISVITDEVYGLGVIMGAVALILLLLSITKDDLQLKKGSAFTFAAAGVVLFITALQPDYLIFMLTLIFMGITFVLLALILLEYYSRYELFLFSLVVSGVFGVIVMLQAGEILILQILSSGLIIAGVFLFVLVHAHHKDSFEKWSGIAVFAGGVLGVLQRILLLSSDSQLIKRELVHLESLPFLTTISGKEIEISSVLDFYTKKVFIIYSEHIGWFLVFIALMVVGISLFLNVSVEKLAVAYFVISGFAVLSDLMIGNFLAIHVLDLSAGIFKAFLFIYPVERMFMAFFATIFGVGVIIPLKKFGIINLIRR